MKKGLIALLVILAVLVALVIAVPALLTPSYPKIEASIGEIEPAALADGDYEGAAFTLPVKVRAKVSVAGGKITAIELLEHFNGRGKPAEAIIPTVIEKQSVKVDVVTGATHSSLTILEAIANALKTER